MAKAKQNQIRIGELAFFIGVLLAIFAGLFQNVLPESAVKLILVIIGLIVGFMNITSKESIGFLISAIALMLVGTTNLSVLPWEIGLYLNNIISFIAVFVAPAAIIVALKVVWELAKSK